MDVRAPEGEAWTEYSNYELTLSYLQPLQKNRSRHLALHQDTKMETFHQVHGLQAVRRIDFKELGERAHEVEKEEGTASTLGG